MKKNLVIIFIAIICGGAITLFTLLKVNNNLKIEENMITVFQVGVYKNEINALKKKYKNVYLLKLDIECESASEEYNENEIGILNSSQNSRHSYYNGLSALSFSDELTAKLLNIDKVTKKFLKVFNIKSKKVKSINWI